MILYQYKTNRKIKKNVDMRSSIQLDLKDIYNSLSMSNDQIKKDYKWLWSSNFPPKVIFFLWKIKYNALPTSENLSKNKYQYQLWVSKMC